MASIKKLPSGRYQVRFRDPEQKQHTKSFDLKRDAQDWLDEKTAELVAGTFVSPRKARTTVGEWCDLWLDGYKGNRKTTVRQAEVHIARIKAAFGHRQLAQVRPSEIRTWCAQLKAEGLADSYVYALHSRLSQLFSDAVHDGMVGRSPCSRRTSPPMGKQRPYVATTEQMWALHAAMPEHLKAAVLLGALVGLRSAEVCGLRVSDIDFMRGIINPAVQYPAEPLKTEASKTPVPIPHDLSLLLSAHVAQHSHGAETVLVNQWGQQLTKKTLERAWISAKAQVPGLPPDLRFHDLRHYLASMLIASGMDVKVVQARMRHASAKVTLDVYGHLWPDSDDSSRLAVSAVMAQRPQAEAKSGS